MAISPERIVELAKKAGFETELRAAHLFASRGWRIRQNVYYVDKDEEKAREYDIYAYRGYVDVKESPEVTCFVNLFVEVKKTEDPFIFFSNKKARVEGGSGYGILHWKKGVHRDIISYNEMERRRPLSGADRIARSYMSAKDGKTHHIQSGLLSALKAAVHYHDECDETYSDTSKDISFFVPLMVVDGDLHECFINRNGEMESEPVSELVYMQNYNSREYGSLSQRVHVVKLDILGDVLDRYHKWGQSLLKVMQKNRAKQDPD